MKKHKQKHIFPAIDHVAGFSVGLLSFLRVEGLGVIITCLKIIHDNPPCRHLRDLAEYFYSLRCSILQALDNVCVKRGFVCLELLIVTDIVIIMCCAVSCFSCFNFLNKARVWRKK